MEYDYSIFKRAAAALRNVLADCETVHSERANFSKLLEGVEVYKNEDASEPIQGRKAPNPFPEPMPNPVYKNAAGIEIMAARRDEAMQAMSPAHRSAIVAMCQERADRRQEPTPEILELYECLRGAVEVIREDSWNKCWSQERSGCSGVTAMEDVCQELADSIAARFPILCPQTSPSTGEVENVPALCDKPRKRSRKALDLEDVKVWKEYQEENQEGGRIEGNRWLKDNTLKDLANFLASALLSHYDCPVVNGNSQIPWKLVDGVFQYFSIRQRQWKPATAKRLKEAYSVLNTREK